MTPSLLRITCIHWLWRRRRRWFRVQPRVKWSYPNRQLAAASPECHCYCHCVPGYDVEASIVIHFIHRSLTPFQFSPFYSSSCSSW
jgi:hypothetical protein